MVPRRTLVNRLITARADAQRAAGIHDPRWYEDPILLPIVSVAVIAAVTWATTLLSAATAWSIGIVLVVLLGAAGLFVRGLGEHRQSQRLKAWGCYLGSFAYTATASVALFNGVPHLLSGG